MLASLLYYVLPFQGVQALAEALAENNSLVELNIKGNDLGDAGLEALATALQVATAI
jgi:hypothetical protein